MNAKSFYKKSLKIFNKMVTDSPSNIYYEQTENGFYFTNLDGVVCRFIPNLNVPQIYKDFMRNADGKMAKHFDLDFSQREEVPATGITAGYLENTDKKVTKLFSRCGEYAYIQTEYRKIFPDNAVFFIKDNYAPVLVTVRDLEKNTFLPLGVICPILCRSKFVKYS